MLESRSQRTVLVVVLLTLLLAGPAGLIGPADSGGSQVGEGTAELAIREPVDGPLLVDRGRFGTGVFYLRTPDLAAEVRSVTGSPRVRYEVRVPSLGVERSGHRVLHASDAGSVITVPLADHAVPRARLDAETHRARVLVRVQSFTGQHVVTNRTLPVEVRR